MFEVPRTDVRLRNKDEVLVMRLPNGADAGRLPVAIDVRLLARHPVYGFAVGTQRYVVVTDRSGANARLTDADGRVWRVTEEARSLGSTLRHAPTPGCQRSERSGSAGSRSSPTPNFSSERRTP